jgi:vacuolar protein sorting-associated protein IST1
MQSTDPPPASVPPRVLSKLALYIPPKELVDAYLGEIAKSYGVPFEAAQPIEALEDDHAPKNEGGDDTEGPGEGQEKEQAQALEVVSAVDDTGKKADTAHGKKDSEGVLPELPSTTPVEAPPKKVNEDDELAKRFERLKNLR